MVLSEDGDHPMTRLSDTQFVILTAAAQRADLSVLPLPETLKLKGGALNKVMDSLRNKGLIRVIETEGRPQRVVLTSEGMAAIGVEREDKDQTTAPADANAALDDYPTHGTPADQGA
jgi:DNA-binding MarR family transcriptional regulator